MKELLFRLWGRLLYRCETIPESEKEKAGCDYILHPTPFGNWFLKNFGSDA